MYIDNGYRISKHQKTGSNQFFDDTMEWSCAAKCNCRCKNSIILQWSTNFWLIVLRFLILNNSTEAQPKQSGHHWISRFIIYRVRQNSSHSGERISLLLVESPNPRKVTFGIVIHVVNEQQSWKKLDRDQI